jgi:hypothetical protein
MPYYKLVVQIALRLALRQLGVVHVWHRIKSWLSELSRSSLVCRDVCACWHCRICCVLMAQPLYMVTVIFIVGASG